MFHAIRKLVPLLLTVISMVCLSVFTLKSTAVQPLLDHPMAAPMPKTGIRNQHHQSRRDLDSAFVLSQQTRNQRIETELITLYQSGFEPREITRPQGPFILGVDNRTGLDGVELQLNRAGGTRVNALQTRKRKISWRDIVDLAPGHYVVSEVNHPEWSCQITITRQ